MILLGSKKSRQKKSPPQADGSRSARQLLLQLQRFTAAIRIGSRVRYHQQYEEASLLETLVVGYQINDHRVYRQSELQFELDELSCGLVVTDRHGSHAYSRIDSFYLIVPDTAGEELKLDHGSRANLGRLGPLAPRSRLQMLSSGFSDSSEQLKFDAEVYRHRQLEEGVHAGLRAVLLSVALGSIESHEARKSARLNADLCVTICRNGTDKIMTAWLRDFSEDCIRLQLEHDDDSWPQLGKKDYLLVGVKASVDKPLVKLRCQCAEQRSDERVFTITHIIRHGEQVAYQKLDALELKIDLMNLV